MDKLFRANISYAMIFSMKQNDIYEIDVASYDKPCIQSNKGKVKDPLSHNENYFRFFIKNYAFFLIILLLVLISVSLAYLLGALLINEKFTWFSFCLIAFLGITFFSMVFILKKLPSQFEDDQANAIFKPVSILLTTIVILFIPSFVWSIALLITTSINPLGFLASGNYLSLIFLLILFSAISSAIWYEQYLRNIVNRVLSRLKRKRK
jgi:hypothetical protein